MNSMFDGYDRIHFDVGANLGKWPIHFARHEPKTFVVVFEPTPELAQHIANETTNLKNFLIVKNAVSDYNGPAKFNVAADDVWGCSSLLEFSDKVKTHWPKVRRDLKTTHTINVDVIRLDRFIMEYNVPKIDYLKIDTQGCDLNVLKGCGEFLSLVKEGTMEAAAIDDVLYKGQNTKDESIKFLNEVGFEIIGFENNDPHGNEVNIYFRNPNPREIKFNKVWNYL